ncbi:divalent cation tolerance protein CutA [Streptomyces sp. IBSNAI002]|uniref:divalent cation tolerance protein CutA n=1 Tax=Streptomyces sp. IBSNAI002 TaxID=3457500 RepID=UPI003FD172F0
MPTDIVIAQTTIDSEHRAAELARGAVEARLAACAHIDAPSRRPTAGRARSRRPRNGASRSRRPAPASPT